MFLALEIVIRANYRSHCHSIPLGCTSVKAGEHVDVPTHKFVIT